MNHDLETVMEFCKNFSKDWITLIGIQIIPEKFKRRTPAQTFSTGDRELIGRFLKEYSDYNIYFSVNDIDVPRNIERYKQDCIDRDQKWTKNRERKATKEDIKTANWLHIDMDINETQNPEYNKKAEEGDPNWFTHFPLTETQFKDQRKQIQDQIKKFPKQPTMIIDSGNGFQCFWRLDPPLQITGETEKDRLKECNQLERYNYQLMLDTDSDKCFNIERIMRLPGSSNFPNPAKLKKGRKIRKTSFLINDLTYTLEDFKQCEIGFVMPKKGVQSLPELVTVPIPKWFYDLLQMHDTLLARWEGSKKGLDKDKSRSSMDFSLLSLLKEDGMKPDQTMAILKEFEHGKINDVKNPQKYFERMWSRAYTTEDWMMIGEQANYEF